MPTKALDRNKTVVQQAQPEEAVFRPFIPAGAHLREL